MANTYDGGIVTAYGAAVRGGYTGTYEQFCSEQAQFGANERDVAAAKTAVESAQRQVEQSVSTFTQTTVPNAVNSVQSVGTEQVGLVQSAGTAQVQAVEAAGAQQVIGVQTEGASQIHDIEQVALSAIGQINDAEDSSVAAVEAAETAATEAVGRAQTAAVQAVQTESTAQQAAVQAKGEEVLASIPEDYTALSGDVSSLKSMTLEADADTIEQITGNRPLIWHTGRYITPSVTGIGETVGFDPNSAFCCVKFPCAEGDEFTLHVGGPAGMTRAWFMVDENMVCIDRAATNMSDQVTITAKSGTAFILVNNQLSKRASGYFVYKGAPSIDERVTDCETAAFDHYAEDISFVQGTLSSSGTPNSSDIRIRSSQYIPVSNLIKASCAENGQLMIFGYDEKRVFLGRITTPRTIWRADDVIAAIPNAQFVRFVFAVQGNPEITPSDAESYDLHCYAAPFANPVSRPLTIDTIKPYLNDNGELTSTLGYKFQIEQNDVVNKIFSIRAKYSGESAPAFRLYAYAPDGEQTLAGQSMQFLGKDEFITQEFRLPNDYSITAYQINLTIPEGSKLIVQDCAFFDDNSAVRGDCGVIVEAHRGLDCIFPGDSYDGIVAAGKCGFKYCITIPKFTSDGVAVCFHNDGVASSPLSEQLSLEDGSAIPGMTDTSKISDYTYAELMQWSIGATRNPAYAGCKILKLDDFFGICSKFGMHPVLSIHPAPTVAQWEQIKAMTDKWGLTPYLSVKSGNYQDVWQRVVSVFGDGKIERIISLYSTSSTYDILDWISTGKQTAGITETPVTAEFFDASLSGETYGAIQKAQLEAAVAAGIHTSVVLQSNTNTAKMHDYIDMGVTEFTNGRFFNCGLLW